MWEALRERRDERFARNGVVPARRVRNVGSVGIKAVRDVEGSRKDGVEIGKTAGSQKKILLIDDGPGHE